MPKKFVVIYDWGYESSYHECDTLEEAIEDRQHYNNPHDRPIYQLVEVVTEYTLPDGTIHREKAG